MYLAFNGTVNRGHFGRGDYFGRILQKKFSDVLKYF